MRRITTLSIVPALMCVAPWASMAGDNAGATPATRASIAASSGLGGPLMGFVANAEAGQVRLVVGIPGAAVIGDSLLAEGAVDNFAPAPAGDWGLAIARPDSRLVLVDVAGRKTQPIEVVAEPVAMLALSANGRSAAVLSSEGQLAAITGLPDAPVRVGLDLSAVKGKVAAMAIDDAGQTILLAVSDAVYAVDAAAGSAPRLAATVANVTALRFLGGRSDAVYLDPAQGSLMLLRDPRGAAESALLAAGGDGGTLAGAMAVADAGAAGVAVAVQNGMALVALDTRAVTVIDCGCSPTLLAPMLDKTVFRLTEPAGDAASLVDISGEAPRVLLLPPPRAATAAAPAADGGVQ
jgi:hypothetical protein